MGNVTILLGVGIVAFILVYLFGLLSRNREEDGNSKHPIIQILILAFIAALILVAAKVTIDDQDNCAWNVINSTVDGNSVIYAYDYQCSVNPNESAVIFYRITTWFAYFLSVYLFIFLVLSVWNYIAGLMKVRVQK